MIEGRDSGLLSGAGESSVDVYVGGPGSVYASRVHCDIWGLV
jgi:hypothetical protein